MFYEVTINLNIPQVVRTIKNKQKVFENIFGKQSYYIIAKNENKAQVGAENILRNKFKTYSSEQFINRVCSYDFISTIKPWRNIDYSIEVKTVNIDSVNVRELKAKDVFDHFTVDEIIKEVARIAIKELNNCEDIH